MPKPHKSGGGVVKTNQKKPSVFNVANSSRATYAGQPMEENWIHKGEFYNDEPARQCAAQDKHTKYCVECDTPYTSHKNECPNCGTSAYYLKRCKNCAEYLKTTCRSHGGTTVMTKEHSHKCRAASITTGLGVADILFCTKTCVLAESCVYFQQLVDAERYGSTVPRCLPEQAMYDSIMHQFKETYELDDVADQVMLDSLAIAIIRRERGRKIVSASGELVDRVRTSPDGSFETWTEPNAISSVIDSLDKRVQAWLKELAITKAAREGKKVTCNINLTNLLSNPEHSGIIDADQIIDVDLDE